MFDSHVMIPLQTIVSDACRPEDVRDPYGVSQAKTALETIYAWLDHALAGRRWVAGDAFSVADAAAAPALFYTDWVHPIDEDRTTLKAHRARPLVRASFTHRIEDTRPYQPFLPLGAPDRD